MTCLLLVEHFAMCIARHAWCDPWRIGGAHILHYKVPLCRACGLSLNPIPYTLVFAAAEPDGSRSAGAAPAYKRPAVQDPQNAGEVGSFPAGRHDAPVSEAPIVRVHLKQGYDLAVQ